MRYRTAGISSAVLVGVTAAMFALPAAVWAVFLPSLKQGLPDPIPGYEKLLLEVALFCGTWKWMPALFTLPIIVVLFIVAELTSAARIPNVITATPAPTGRPPALWNPVAAVGWSLLFSPAFGAFLHARNADTLGRADEAKANRVWFYVIIAYFGFSLLPIPYIPEVLFRLAPIGLLLGWYFGPGKRQITYVKETWRDRYQRKPWTKPLLIAFCILVGTIIVLTTAAKLVSGLH